jgi:hypothetical protein
MGRSFDVSENNYVEDVYVGAEQGPVIHRHYNPFFFKIDFESVVRDYFQKPTMLMEGLSIGQARRRELHKLLDQHIDDFEKGLKSNPYIPSQT